MASVPILKAVVCVNADRSHVVLDKLAQPVLHPQEGYVRAIYDVSAGDAVSSSSHANSELALMNSNCYLYKH